MKLTLSIEESARLIDLGVDPKLASGWEYESRTEPFTLTNILAILPKVVTYNGVVENLTIFIDNNCSVATYPFYNSNDATFSRTELIDALYSLLIWTIENGHLNQKKQ